MRYRYVAFDVDGTLLDTAHNELTALRRLVAEVTGRTPSWEALQATFSMPGLAAMEYLGCTPEQAAQTYPRWDAASAESIVRTPLVNGFAQTLAALHRAGVGMGLVTSRGHSTVDLRFPPQGEGRYFPVQICDGDTAQNKPAPEPLLECLRRAGVHPADALYVGDSLSDMQCAQAAGVDSALALWGAQRADLPSTRKLARPEELLALCLPDEQA